jgi:hypothetical protein
MYARTIVISDLVDLSNTHLVYVYNTCSRIDIVSDIDTVIRDLVDLSKLPVD